MKRLKTRNRLYRVSCWMLVPLLLLSCGGGGGTLADGGIGGTGITASGSITATGSIFVNGIEYSIAGAELFREGETSVTLATEQAAGVEVGMVVEVDGLRDNGASTGQARTIRYRDILEGPIDGVTPLGANIKLLAMLGQSVVVEDGFTQMNSISFAGLDTFTGRLEVSGLRLPDGRIQASYLENKPLGGYEIEGVITLVEDANRFWIGALQVTHDGPANPAVGDLVEVKGRAYAAATNDLSAMNVELAQRGLSLQNKTEAEVEGFVSGTGAIKAGDTFLVNGQSVRFSVSTLFEQGSAADLVHGTKVEVEGNLSNGVITAAKISFKETIRLEGDISSIDPATDSLTIDGLDGPPGIRVVVGEGLTEFNGTTGLGGSSSLLVGDHVRLRGSLTAQTGTVEAARLDLRSPSVDVELRGPVEDSPIVSGQITILGINVDTTSISQFSIEQDDGSLLTTDQATFFNLLQTGEVVRLKGTLSGSSVSWSNAEKQNEN